MVAGCSSGGELPERVGDLTDEQILDICEPVERQTNVECGEGANSFVIEETPGARECAEGLERHRDSETEACRLVTDVIACRDAGICEEFSADRDSSCRAECPERAECWTFAPEDCPDNGHCVVVTGQKWSESGACYTNENAYCMPTGYLCADAVTNALDADGGCWLMSTICMLPGGWKHEEPGLGSCPYSGGASCGE